MSNKNQALIFVLSVAAAGGFFAFRVYPSTEWIPLTIMGSLFFLMALLIIFLGGHNIRLATTESKEALKKLLAQEAEPFHEKVVELEERDIKILERHVPWTYAGLAVSALAAMLIIGWDNFFVTSASDRFIGQMLSAFLGAGALIFSVIMLAFFKSRTKRIRKQGNKTIIRGIVTGRSVLDNRPRLREPRSPTERMGQVDYFLHMGSKKFSVDYKNFKQTAEGDAVEMHYITDAHGKPLVLHFYLLKKEIVHN